MNDLGRTGRSDLLDLVAELRVLVGQLQAERDHAVDMARRQMVLEGCLTCRGGAEYKAMLANLSSVQARCTDLLVEVRAYRASGICLPGWNCTNCHAFNGSVREMRTHCRACGASK